MIDSTRAAVLEAAFKIDARDEPIEKPAVRLGFVGMLQPHLTHDRDRDA
ncbi:MAG: hypothetical protein ACLPSH_02445 [Vulcanimicrobiaceae bacterium]